jgi:hypothetical protein
MDVGSQTGTCHLRHLINKFKVVSFDKTLYNVSNHPHKAQGQGYLKFVASPRPGDEKCFACIRVWFTPTLPATMVSPGEIVHLHSGRVKAYSSCSHPADQTGHVHLIVHTPEQSIFLPGPTKNLLLWTLPLVPCPDDSCLKVNALMGYSDGIKAVVTRPLD